MSPEDNPADDIQPTKEEWEAWHRGLTKEEAQAAYDTAPSIPLSDERIKEIVAFATAGGDMNCDAFISSAAWLHRRIRSRELPK